MITASKRGRILFYGGCHAQALSRIYRKFCTDADIVFDTIINFDLIARRAPFPYDDMGRYDAVIYSPIAHKPGYETSQLEDACARAGTQAISFPWLEWRGYFPLAEKQPFLTVSAWAYPEIQELARSCHDDAAHAGAVDVLFSDKSRIMSRLASTTAHLIAHEQKHACSIRISDFVSQNYRKRRLFLTPDHPAKPIYDLIVQFINEKLCIEFDSSFFVSAAEPQHGIKTPIHPRVAEVLELEFCDADYQHSMSDFGQRSIQYREYLTLCRGLGLGHVMLRSNSATFLKRRPVASSELASEDKVCIAPGALLQGKLEPVTGGSQHVHLVANWGEADVLRRVSSWADVFLYRPHWEIRPPRRVSA